MRYEMVWEKKWNKPLKKNASDRKDSKKVKEERMKIVEERIVKKEKESEIERTETIHQALLSIFLSFGWAFDFTFFLSLRGSFCLSAV